MPAAGWFLRRGLLPVATLVNPLVYLVLILGRKGQRWIADSAARRCTTPCSRIRS